MKERIRNLITNLNKYKHIIIQYMAYLIKWVILKKCNYNTIHTK